MDIYDTSTGLWSKANLSQARYVSNATSSGSKVFFGGGWTDGKASNVVDIYDASSGLWSKTTWSQPHDYPATASASGMVFFAGGWTGSTYLNAVEVYNTSTDLWSTASLSQARYGLAAASVGNKVLFGGGSEGNVYSKVVDIYDTSTGVWSTANLSQARLWPSATSVGNKVLFAGGFVNGGYSNLVEIYTLQTYGTITSSKAFTLVDQTTVTGRMQLNVGAGLNLDGYNLTVGSMAGVAPISLSTHMLTTGCDNTDSAYSGPMSGNGNLIKTGDGALTLSGNNSYLGLTTVNAGELVLVGPNAWNPIMNLGGAYISGGEMVFDYTGNADPYETVLSLLNVKINGSMPISVMDDAVNDRVTVSITVPELSALLLAGASLLSLLAYAWWRPNRGV